MTKLIRQLGLAMAILFFAAAWAGVIITYFSTDSITAFTIAVTAAALATESLIWALAIIGGWTLFANRRKFWQKLTGRPADRSA
jgi:hypothetical protein